jgi:hypothetical protein
MKIFKWIVSEGVNHDVNNEKKPSNENTSGMAKAL